MFFNYRARDVKGVCSSGKIEAVDEDSAVKQLQATGLVVTFIEGTLVQCRECAKDISREAITCPNCGCPQKKEVVMPGEVICPNSNCGYRGEPKKEPRGSTLVGCFLCLFFLLPGILYFLFKSGYRYVCPKCGLQLKSDN